MTALTIRSKLDCAPFIKEIGRGRDNARAMTREQAALLWGALLDGRIADLEVGAILLAMRIKGESIDEIAGFLDATDACGMRLRMPVDARGKPSIPVVIPSYNGARNMPNLTPLLACLLAREGVPVLVHGKVATVESQADRETLRTAHAFATPTPSGGAATPPPRVTSAEIFETMGMPIAHTADDASAQFARCEPVFMAITDLNPALAKVLALRRVLGVRSPAHTLVKLLQPFAEPALRLASYTHPEYHATLSGYFTQVAQSGGVLLMRGTEGEPVANARRPATIERFLDGKSSAVITGETGVVLSGERPVPDAIAAQCKAILEARDAMDASAVDPIQAVA